MDKKISELDQALQINNDAVFPISQDNGGTDTTYKVSITQLSSEVGEDQTFSNLQTSSKKLVGAINELYQGGGGGGSSTLAGLNDVDIDDQTLSDGQVLKYDSAEDKWVNDDVGAGGHTIVADDGTDLTQRANLQFIGAYSEDNSVDDTTEVNVVRNMTKAQFDLLTADEKTGFINTTDETSQIYATEIPMSALDSDTVAEKLDEKVDTADYTAELLPIESGSATNTKDYIDSKLSSYLYTLSTSDFTWDNSGRYVSNYTIDHYIGSKSVKMMSVYSTNGDAIMNSRLSGSNYINVLGLKTDGTAITSAYQFSLTILAI